MSKGFQRHEQCSDDRKQQQHCHSAASITVKKRPERLRRAKCFFTSSIVLVSIRSIPSLCPSRTKAFPDSRRDVEGARRGFRRRVSYGGGGGGTTLGITGKTDKRWWRWTRSIGIIFRDGDDPRGRWRDVDDDRPAKFRLTVNFHIDLDLQLVVRRNRPTSWITIRTIRLVTACRTVVVPTCRCHTIWTPCWRCIIAYATDRNINIGLGTSTTSYRLDSNTRRKRQQYTAK